MLLKSRSLTKKLALEVETYARFVNHSLALMEAKSEESKLKICQTQYLIKYALDKY